VQPAKTVDVSGTGFAVTASGYVVTNNHVIANCVGDVHGNLASGAVMTLRVASTDQINDLALLQAPTRFPEPATIRSTAVHPGEAVIAVGYPYHGLLTSDLTVTTGTVSSLSGVLNDSRYLQISAPIQPGNSGGPLLDKAGAVVGVAAAKLNALQIAKVSGGPIPENINFGIKTGLLRDFLDNSAVPYQTAAPGAELKTEEVAAKARAYTLLVSCTAKQTAQQ
jgi:S1-C subfamily serine protease